MRRNAKDAALACKSATTTTRTVKLTIYSTLLLLLAQIATNNLGSAEPSPQRQRQSQQYSYVESGAYTQRQHLQGQSQRYPGYSESVSGDVDEDGALLSTRRRGNRPLPIAAINPNEVDAERNGDVETDDDEDGLPGNMHWQRQRQQQLQQQRLQRKQQLARGQLRAGGSAIEANKCRIWVPAETVDKYPYASRIQPDQRNQLQMIEVCCPGYGPMRWRGSTVCKPLCENCRNGFCVAPDECQCYEEFVANDNGDCVFTCPLGCLNGRCYLDGTCQCEPGYKLDETRKYCRPICSSGCGTNPRHNCTEPEVCGCAKGYQLTDEGCQPTCEPDCGVGGRCHEPNLCQCAPGYALKDSVCQRDCYQKCDNGICYSNNRCICNPGFTYHERSTQCVPK